MEEVKPKTKCDECGSQYFIESSQMKSLCPECTFYFYGYKICDHKMENGICIKCYWDGSASEYINSIKQTFKSK